MVVFLSLFYSKNFCNIEWKVTYTVPGDSPRSYVNMLETDMQAKIAVLFVFCDCMHSDRWGTGMRLPYAATTLRLNILHFALAMYFCLQYDFQIKQRLFH
jgi:hypothetical protein